MRQSLVAVFMLVVSLPAVATADLSCKGDEYFLYMSVGSDNTVDSAVLTDESTKASITYRLIENTQLIWKDDEGDFSANRLKLTLRNKDGTSSMVEAKGRNGVLHHLQKTYKLDCDWGER